MSVPSGSQSIGYTAATRAREQAEPVPAEDPAGNRDEDDRPRSDHAEGELLTEDRVPAEQVHERDEKDVQRRMLGRRLGVEDAVEPLAVGDEPALQMERESVALDRVVAVEDGVQHPHGEAGEGDEGKPSSKPRTGGRVWASGTRRRRPARAPA